MKILVTGGAGFIGSNFIYYQLSHHPEDNILCYDALTYAGNLETLKEAEKNPHFQFIRGDIADRAAVYEMFVQEKRDILVSFAAESHVDRSIEQPDVFLRTNFMGTGVLLDACRKYGIERYHQISTDEVYGDLPLDRPDLFFTEETNLHASSPYSASKASADLLVMAYHRTYGLPVTISRCSNNYGPYHFPEKLIPLVINNILAGKPLPVYGKGDNIRDWLYVEDHCKAIDLVVRRGREGEVYNVGGHNEMTNIDIVKLTIKTIREMMEEDKSLRCVLKKQERDANGDIDISWMNESLISYVADRLGHDQRYGIDPTKISSELGWLPETRFTDGIVKTIRWNLENQQWIGEVTSGDYQKYYEEMYGNR